MASVQNLPVSDSLPDGAVSASDGTPSEVAQACGLQLFEDAWGNQTRPTQPLTPQAATAALADGALSWLTDCSILRVHGDDAVRFLHSQTTNDLTGQGPDTARWHGYCSPKGRLLALMLAWHEEDGVRLMLPQRLVESIRQRLSMFVLRSKVRIADESETLAVFGLFGQRARVALGELGLEAPASMQLVSAQAQFEGSGEHRHRLTAIGMPAIGTDALVGPENSSSAPNAEAAADAATTGAQRWLLVVPMALAEIVWQRLSTTLTPVDSRLWRWARIRNGIASIGPATSERFVPQMLNLDAEAVTGISFTKGCYPGQEVVARSHYLGKAKRRTFLARILPADGVAPLEPAPGTDVVDASGRPVGIVVSAAPSPGGDMDLLFSGQTDAVDKTPLSIGETPAAEPTSEAATDGPAEPLTSSAPSAAGQTLQLLALPYSLPISS